MLATLRGLRGDKDLGDFYVDPDARPDDGYSCPTALVVAVSPWSPWACR